MYILQTIFKNCITIGSYWSNSIIAHFKLDQQYLKVVVLEFHLLAWELCVFETIEYILHNKVYIQQVVILQCKENMCTQYPLQIA